MSSDSKRKTLFKLIIPSLLGVLLFLVPIRYNGSSELLVGLMGSWAKKILGNAFIPLIVIVIVINVLLVIIHRIKPIPFLKKNKKLNDLFTPNTFWFITMVVGAVLTLLCFFRIGPEAIWSDDTGNNMLAGILPSCVMWYIIGGFFLSLLTDYGLMDLLSSFFTKVSRPLFQVPGRAMIDCVTSWMGSSICGVYLTVSQYEAGLYNAKEAAIIICNFSLLSVSFCSLIASMLDLQGMFGLFYLTIVIAGFICAIVLPRLWPLRGFSQEYDKISGKQAEDEVLPDGKSSLRTGYERACLRAEKANGLVDFIKNGAENVLSLMVSTLPCMMTFGTIALIIATYTPVFDYLGMPLGYFLKLFQIPDAMRAGSAMLVGFVDQFVPVIVGGGFAALPTRFLVGAISILQIVYITDVGTLILTSRVPLNLWHLFVIFLERIVLSIPIVVLCMHLFGIA